ncbi:MAG: Re/Si-specific NAD(P)(+) transhydrogenase subunit alpha [Gemmatimonadota bacterium]
MIIGVLRETFPGERRIALTPDVAAHLVGQGMEVVVEAGAGVAAGFPDEQYTARGVAVAPRAQVLSRAAVVLQVRTAGANPAGDADLAAVGSGHTLIGFCDPLDPGDSLDRVAASGATLFSMELMPRITRAQSMDALSSMATLSGYKAVLLAASELPRIFPLMMTAAGTLAPARVLVIGAGVAGLQAIATSRRLGARVSAYDVRPAVREQVESLGAAFVDLGLDTGDAEDAGGYARQQSQDFYRRQQEALGKVIAGMDVVITTAAVPGKRAPVLVTEAMVQGMAPQSVIVDLAAERGGNCAVTRPGETVEAHGVRVIGPVNLPATVPNHASQMYAHNISTFLLHLVKDGQLQLDTEDEITRETLVTRGGQVVHARALEARGQAPAAPKGE